MAEPTTDYDLWVTDSTRTPQHVTSIFGALHRATEPQRKAAAARRRWPYLLNVSTGHLNGHQLCWVCARNVVYTGRWLPRFRVCGRCLGEDKRQARTVGLLHLLPVFDWSAPPVRIPARTRALDPDARAVVADVWSAVSVLDRWRIALVRGRCLRWGIGESDEVHLDEWRRLCAEDPDASPDAWSAYVTAHWPALHDVLARQAQGTTR